VVALGPPWAPRKSTDPNGANQNEALELVRLPHNFAIVGEPSNISVLETRSRKITQITHINQLVYIFDVHFFPTNVTDEVHQTQLRKLLRISYE
jgi:hypothetical protein